MNKVLTQDFTISRLSKNNINDLSWLHYEVYGSKKPEEYFNNKYNTHFTGIENIGFIAYNNNNQPIAFYGVIPCFIQYGKEIVLAAQSADTMTHPGFRFKGMFVELSNITFELCQELGIKLVFGFPNQNSYHGAVTKLGWKLTDNLQCFSLDISSFPLERLALKFKLLNRIYSKYCLRVLKKFKTNNSGVNNSVIQDNFAGIQRNNDYLHYKKYSQSMVLGICNSKIWISLKNGIQIGDFEGLNKDNFELVLGQLKSIASKMGKRNIQFHCSPGTTLFQLFSGRFKSVPSFPMLFKDFGSSIKPELVKFTLADTDIF